MPPVNLSVATSRKLCEEAGALRDSAKLTVARSKEALTRSQAMRARIEKQRRARNP